MTQLRLPALGWTILIGIFLLLPTVARAADQAKPPRGWLDPLCYRDLAVHGAADLRHVEAVEMFTAIVNGSQMGPGEGWFHACQGRYSWKWLAQRCDADHDGIISLREFTGSTDDFLRLDRDHNGVLTADDFDWSERSPYVQKAQMAQFWFRMIDRNSNGRVSRDEWEAFFNKMAKDREYITPDDLRDALFPAEPYQKPGKSPGGPPPLLLLSGLLQGELGSLFPGPSVGQQAPAFALQREDGKGTIALGEFLGKKPIVLVFGSFT
jgi:hypothetical protein